MIYSKICKELLARGRGKSGLAKGNYLETLDSIRTWLVRPRTGSQAKPTSETRKPENQTYKRYSDELAAPIYLCLRAWSLGLDETLCSQSGAVFLSNRQNEEMLIPHFEKSTRLNFFF